MRIEVMTMDNRAVVIDASGSDTVLELKRVLEGRTGIPTEAQGLVLRGKSMHNDLTLNSFDMRERELIHLVKRVAGC